MEDERNKEEEKIRTLGTIEDNQTSNDLINNYFGAHNNYKIDFRNKKFRHVYNQLIHRRPAMPEHYNLYYEDLLFTIVKTIEWSFYNKQNFVQNIEPFYHFGKKAINQKRVIDSYCEVDPQKKAKISRFISLCIEFSSKIAFFLKEERDFGNASLILEKCYNYLIKEILKSFTSNIRVLKKCVEFFLIYASFCIERNFNDIAQVIVKDALNVIMNLTILIKFQFEKNQSKKRPTKKCTQILKLITKTLLLLSMIAESRYKFVICYQAIKDAITIEKVIKVLFPKYTNLTSGLENCYHSQALIYEDLQQICSHYFQKNQLMKHMIQKPPSVFPYKFSIMTKYVFDSNKWKKQGSNLNFFSNYFSKKSNKTQKEVRFMLTDSKVEKQVKGYKKENRNKIQLIEDSAIGMFSEKSFDLIQSNNSMPLKSLKQVDQSLQMEKLWGVQDFQSLIKPKRASSVQLHKTTSDNFQKRPLEARFQTCKNKKNSKSVIKLHQKRTLKKKNIKFTESDFMKKKSMNSFIPYQKAQTKINQWHKCSETIKAELNSYINKLKQKSNPAEQKLQQFCKQQILNMKSNNQFSHLKFQKFNDKGKNPQKKNQLKGLNLFRSILLENRKQFKIVLPQLFAIKYESMDSIKLNLNRKSLLPNLDQEKEEMKGQKLQKNHQQAMENLQFFMEEYQKSLKMNKNKKRVEKQNQREKQVKIYDKERQMGQLFLKQNNTSLFTTSLKGETFMKNAL